MTDIAKNESFETKMKNRIKDSIGDLISDEDLSRLINSAMNDVFFKDRVAQSKTTYGSTTTKEPLIHEIIKECLTVQIKDVAQEWIKAHPKEVNEILDQILRDGVGNIMISTINDMFEGQLTALRLNIQNGIGQQY